MRAEAEHAASYFLSRIQAGPITHLRIGGVIDETFSPKAIAAEMLGQAIVDLGRVERISSFGVRQWIELAQTLPPGVLALYLVNVPPPVVDQLNLVEGFSGVATVLSVLAPYHCDKCKQDRVRLVDLKTEGELLATGAVPQHTCPSCREPLAFADSAEEYFHFARTHPIRGVDPAVSRYLATALAVAEAPEVTSTLKMVVDDVTFVRLASTLKGDLSVRRLAGGLEGQVAFDCGGVTSVEPEGGPKLIEVLNAAAAQAKVFLWRVTPPVLAALAKAKTPPAGVGIASLFLPAECRSCGTRLSQRIDTQAYAAMLAEPGESAADPCPICGGATRLPRYREAPPVLEAMAARDVPVAQLESIEARALSRMLSTDSGSGEGTPGSQSGLDGGSQSRKLQILRRIGQGGMAEVFLAKQQGLKGFEKYVCLKKVTPEFARRPEFVELLFAEARASARLSHPNVVQIFDVGMLDGAAYITMEYVRGPDLRRVIGILRKAGKAFPLPHALRICAEVASGLHYAHSYVDPAGTPHPLIHRDVSPHNMLVSLDGAVKLSDFGIAKMMNEAEEVAQGAFKGKVPYSSPEAVQGRELDARSDVFSLGVCLYEFLTGRLPFRGETDAATMRQIVADEPTPLKSLRPDVGDDVVAIARKALEKQVEARYGNAGQVRDDIEAAMLRNGLRASASDVARFVQGVLGDKAAEFLAGREVPSTPGGSSGGTPARGSGSISSPHVIHTPAPAGPAAGAEEPKRIRTGVNPSPSDAPVASSDPAASSGSRSGVSSGSRSGVSASSGSRSGMKSSSGLGTPARAQGTPAPSVHHARSSGGTPAPVHTTPRTSGGTPAPFTSRSAGGTPAPLSQRTGASQSMPAMRPGSSGMLPLGAGIPAGSNPAMQRPRPSPGMAPSAPMALSGSRPAVTPSSPAPAPSRAPLFLGVVAVTLLVLGGGAWMLTHRHSSAVEVAGLESGDHLYVDGQQIAPDALRPSPDPVMLAVAHDGHLKRLGRVAIQRDLDLTLLVDASSGATGHADLDASAVPEGCQLLVGGAPAKRNEHTVTVDAGQELLVEVGCGGKPAWSGWVMAAPGQTVKLPAQAGGAPAEAIAPKP